MMSGWMTIDSAHGLMAASNSLTGKLFRKTSLVAVMTLLSRLLGFVRDMVLAQIFGAGATFDAFVIAFKIPNFMRRLFAEGAFAQAFVPIMAEYRETRSPEALRAFLNHIAGALGLAVLLVVALAELIAPLLIMVFAPGFAHEHARFMLATHMLRITFPYLALISLTAFAGAILNTFGRFGVPAFTPVLLNVALIAVAWFWAPHAQTPIFVLAWGVVIGGVAQLALQIPFLWRKNLLPIPKISFRDPGVRRVLKLMVPALFGVSVAQLSLLIDNIFASFLPAGSISWLYYSDRLTYLPLGVIGVALATVVMPYLSRQHSSEAKQHFSATIDWALRTALTIGIPSAIGLFLLAGPLIATLFHHGSFNDRDVYMTRESLWAFSVGLPGFMLVKILASAFYAQKNIKTPVKIAAVAMVMNLVLNAALIIPLRHAGLALATSISSLFNAICLLVLLIKYKQFSPSPRWALFSLRLLVANTLMGLLVWYLDKPISQWLTWHIGDRILHLALLLVTGLVAYFAVLLLCGMRLGDFRPPAVS